MVKSLKGEGIILIISVSATPGTVPGEKRIFGKCEKNTPKGDLSVFFHLKRQKERR